MSIRRTQRAAALCAMSALFLPLTPASYARDASEEVPQENVIEADVDSDIEVPVGDLEEEKRLDTLKQSKLRRNPKILPQTLPRADEPNRVVDLEVIQQRSVRVPAYFHDVIQLGQWDGKRLNDVALIEENGDLVLYPHDFANSYQSSRRIGHGRNNLRQVMGGGDFNGDGKADILAL